MRKPIIVMAAITLWGGLFLLGCPAKNSPSSPGSPAAPTNTPTATPTATSTATNLGGFTSTFTVTSSPTSTPTVTPTPTITSTPTLTFTSSPTPTPTLTSTDSPTPTVTVTFTFTLTSTPTSSIRWFKASASNTGALLYLQVAGAAVTDAGVTLSGPSLSSALTYVGNATEGAGSFAVYLGHGILPYQPGSAYSLTTVTSAGTASVTITAPGGSPMTLSPDGFTCTWSNPGNLDQVETRDIGANSVVYVSATGVTSPFTMPGYAYSGPGTYTAGVFIANSGIPTNAQTGSNFTYGSDPEIGYTTSVTYVYLSSSIPTATFTATPSTHTYLTQWGTPGTGDGQLNQPEGIAVIGGYVYVVDTFNNRVQKFDTNGNFRLKWGKNGGDGTSGQGNGQFYYPEYITGDGAGNLYVADTYNNRVQKFFDTGSAVTWVATWGRNGGDGTAGTALGEFSTPSGIVLDPSSSYLYISDFGNNRVQQWTTLGTAVTQFGTTGAASSQFNGPSGVAMDSETNNLYIADYYNNRVKGVQTNGIYLGYIYTTLGSSAPASGTGNGELANPFGITIDSSSHLYAADFGNNRIQEFYIGGPVSYMGKWGRNGGDGSSGSNSYEFNQPMAVAVDGSDNVYVADKGNNRIQKFGP